MKKNLQIITLILVLTSCNEHNKTTVILKGYNGQETVIYQTEYADYYVGYNDLVAYCEKEDNGEPNDFTFNQIIEYLESYPDKPILIPDTLGTKLEMESEVFFTESDSLIRVRDQDHPYAYIKEDVRWALLELTTKGKIKIYHKETESFLDTIIVDKVDTDWYGETNITLTNDSIFFSQLRWIK